MSKIAINVINNANTILKAQKIYDELGDVNAEKPKMLEGK